MVKIDLSQFPKLVNKVYHPVFRDTKRYEVLYGGAGSGKSVTAAQKIIYRMITEKNHKFLAARKVKDTIRESVRAELIDAIESMGLRSLFFYSDSPTGEMTIKGPNNNSIIFRGFDNVEKLKSLKGITSAWLEEASEFLESDLDQLDLRIRGKNLKNYKQIILTFNPISEHHWLKKRFFDRVEDDAYVLKTTYLDNNFIDDEYKRRIEALKETNQTYYKVYALGEWGTLKGAIYENYKVIDKMPEHAELETLGLDFGYVHPQVLVHAKIDKNNLYIDEVYYRSEKTNSHFLEWLQKNRSDLLKVQVFPDTARPDLISDVKNAGMRVGETKKDVFTGINILQGMNIHITARSANILREIKTYCWKMDKDGNTLEEPVKENDDAMDAMRYAISPLISKKTGAKSLKLGLI